MKKDRPIAKPQRVAGGDGKVRPGSYVVTYEGGGGPPLYAEFDTFKEAMEEAKSTWGSCLVEVYDSKGKSLCSDNWNMRFQYNMLRIRTGKLNPRQEHILEKWSRPKRLNKIREFMEKRGCNPESVLKMMENALKNKRKARELFFESLCWGVFEFIGWINGWHEPEGHYIDDAIESGKIKVI
jgi:hypothetical protein